MASTEISAYELGRQFLGALDKTQLSAAASKLFASSVGEIVMLLSRSSTHKHYSLADIEWMVLPAVTTGQFYVVEAASKLNGFRVPIAFVTWAFVSDEVDRRLAGQCSGSRARLRPDEWKSGKSAWLIDAIGSTEGVKAALQWLKDGPLKDQSLKLSMGSFDKVQVGTLDGVISSPVEGHGR